MASRYLAEKDECRQCGGLAQFTPDSMQCAECGREIEGSGEYDCDCGNSWVVGKWEVGTTWHNDLPYCPECSVPDKVWCPICEANVNGSAYLFREFGDRDKPLYHVACLVTHYRHSHLNHWDRQHSNRYYQRSIPGYDYDVQKREVNNRAMRQLIRRVWKLVKDGQLPEHVDAVTFVDAMTRLKHADEKTITLATQTHSRINGLQSTN